MLKTLCFAGLVMVGVTGCAQPSAPTSDLTTLYPSQEEMSAHEIISKAYAAAGGETWTRPKTLYLDGYGVFYKNGNAVTHESHKMWRVYDAGKTDAHNADGKVRIESIRDGKAVIDISFDGTATYTPAGPQAPSAADAQWSNSFGFGVIRHALDEGYSVTRLPDDLLDGQAAFLVQITDPVGGQTHFAIRQNDYAVVKVGFNTPRGWHERKYSNFYTKPDSGDWVQPGRVRLYYNGVKVNEVIWTDFAINQDVPDCLFVLPEAEGCR